MICRAGCSPCHAYGQWNSCVKSGATHLYTRPSHRRLLSGRQQWTRCQAMFAIERYVSRSAGIPPAPLSALLPADFAPVSMRHRGFFQCGNSIPRCLCKRQSFPPLPSFNTMHRSADPNIGSVVFEPSSQDLTSRERQIL